MKSRVLLFLALTTGVLVAGYAWQVNPLPGGPPVLVTLAKRTTLGDAFAIAEAKGVIRNGRLSALVAKFRGVSQLVNPGTYRISPGMSIRQVAESFQAPIRFWTRIPEGFWVGRTASRLAKGAGIDEAEYTDAASDHAAFELAFGRSAPTSGLEGYLFPDTYDIPPDSTGVGIVARQLEAFKSKALPVVPPGTDLHRTVIIASLVELEAARDDERAKIAGVIENRLRKGMRLELDATVLYALQEWKVLGPGVVRTVRSPFNTYLNRGLPPGPIGSPGLASIKAAAYPQRHEFLFYVARPDRSHLFARSYAEHLVNIRQARREAKP